MKLLSSDWPTCCDRKMTQIGSKPFTVTYQCAKCDGIRLFDSCSSGHPDCAYDIFMATPEWEVSGGPVN